MFTLNFLQFFGTTLVEGGLEGQIMGVTKEAMEFPSLSGSWGMMPGVPEIQENDSQS